MPHKCAKCSLLYPAQAEQLFKGCSCGSRIFIYMRDEQVTLKETLEMHQREGLELVAENKQLQEISEIAPISIEKIEKVESAGEETVAKKEAKENKAEIKIEVKKPIPALAQELQQQYGAELQEEDLTAGPQAENITIKEKGHYELDLHSLMVGNPLVIKSEKGVFHIRIPSSPIKRGAK